MFLWQLIFFDCIYVHKVNEFNEAVDSAFDRENDLTILSATDFTLDNHFKIQNEKESTKQSENKKESLDKLIITNFTSTQNFRLISKSYDSVNLIYSAVCYNKIRPRSPPYLII